IREDYATDTQIKEEAGDTGSEFGSGGMSAEARAGVLASRRGATTTITNGRSPEMSASYAESDAPGTKLWPDTNSYKARRQWLASHLQMRCTVTLDQGAVERLREAGSSLLPVGVVAVDCDFHRGEMVACIDEVGDRIACGLSNYSALETERIAGKKSTEIAVVLGYSNEEELIHRDNLVLL